MGEKLLRFPSKVPVIYVDLSEAYSTCYGWELRLSGFRGKSPYWKLRYARKKYFGLHVSFCVDLNGTYSMCMECALCAKHYRRMSLYWNPRYGEIRICWEPK